MQMEVEGGELGRSVEILGTAGKSDAVAAWLRVEVPIDQISRRIVHWPRDAPLRREQQSKQHQTWTRSAPPTCRGIMRDNVSTSIIGRRVKLVPYLHVVHF